MSTHCVRASFETLSAFLLARPAGFGDVELAVDASESNNIADERPAVAARLSKTLHAWVAELPDDYDKLEGGKRE